MSFTEASVPSQSGRVFVVTGPTSGIGLSTALVLAARGARVVLAARNPERTAAAMARIRAATPGALLDEVVLDLASLDSVRAAARDIAARFPRIDVLVNNAGVMAIPQRETLDGFELQFGTNHLGHFALTGLLLPHIKERVVTVSSRAHRAGRLDLADVPRPRHYRRWGSYCMSKLANVLFASELQRRLSRAGSAVRSLSCEPGFVNTNLLLVGPRMEHSATRLLLARVGGALFGRSPAVGALPVLRATTDPGLPGGAYLAPTSRSGRPEPASPSASAGNEGLARRLWEVSESLTGVHFDLRKA